MHLAACTSCLSSSSSLLMHLMILPGNNRFNFQFNFTSNTVFGAPGRKAVTRSRLSRRFNLTDYSRWDPRTQLHGARQNLHSLRLYEHDSFERGTSDAILRRTKPAAVQTSVTQIRL
uniref:Uncharacterized protein n=1 Tax=Ixodes ricinus TaxID=34613 RepID=A0A6B0ULW8_IXORI